MKLIILIFIYISQLSAQLLISNNGPCGCDMTSNMCDSDCCCDSTCSAAQIQTFTCANDKISPLSYGCLPAELIFQNNTAFLNTTIGSQYCVYQDNYTLRNFYYAPTLLSSSAIKAIADSTIPMPTVLTLFDASTLLSLTNYIMGNPIYSVIRSVSVGILSLSRPSLSVGACVDGLPIGYLVNEIVSCSRVITNLANDCANLPSSSFYYQQNMVVPASPSIMFTQFNSLTNFSTGIYFAAVNCIGCVYPTQTSYNPTLNLCLNVVTQVKYEIYGETNITAVNITLNFSNVSATFNQQFNVTFIKSGLSLTGSAYSGNPGYIQGYAVKGTFDNVTMQDFKMISSGNCLNGSSSSVLFGVNSFSDCSVNILTANNNCSLINSNLITSFSQYFVPFIAAYGNLSLDNLVPRTTNDGSSLSNGSCLVITKLTVYIIFARNGTLTLPQNKVIGYQTSFSYDSITNYNLQYWVSVSVKFVDNSQTLFDLDSAVAQRSSKTSVQDFLYLLYVENRAPLTAAMMTKMVLVTMSLSLLLWL